MITRQQLLDYLGGTYSSVAHKLGYKNKRADNNIRQLPDVLTERQRDAIILRMKAKRIKVPASWIE